jgi:hypothetical protein
MSDNREDTVNRRKVLECTPPAMVHSTWLALSPAVVFSRSMAEILPSGTKAFARRC